MAAKITVSGERETAREIDRLRKRLRMTGAEFADEAGKTVRDSVMFRAQPFGSGNAPHQRGIKAIRKDLARVFRIVGDSRRGRNVVGSVGEAKKLHEARRNARGRTLKGRRHPIRASVFFAYRHQVESKVGMAKGSLAGGGDARLGGVSRLNKWTRRWASKGSAKKSRGVRGSFWTFRANPPHVATANVMGTRGVKSALSRVDRRLASRLRRKINAELKRAGKKVNS